MDRFQENLFCPSSTTTNQESINNCSIATRKMCVELLEPVGGTLREMEQVKGKSTPHWYRQCLWLLNEKKMREHFAIKEQCQVMWISVSVHCLQGTTLRYGYCRENRKLIAFNYDTYNTGCLWWILTKKEPNFEYTAHLRCGTDFQASDLPRKRNGPSLY